VDLVQLLRAAGPVIKPTLIPTAPPAGQCGADVFHPAADDDRDEDVREATMTWSHINDLGRDMQRDLFRIGDAFELVTSPPRLA
jgi:hypothetical protein